MPNPAGRLTRGTIIDHALKRVGNTKLTSLARVRLNLVLDDLYIQHEWPFLNITSTQTISGATFALPSDFLKTQDDDALTITVADGNDVKWVVRELSRKKFEQRSIPADATATAPKIWHPDRQADVGRVWPLPLSSVTASLRYKQRPAAVDVTDTNTYDADVPTFPYHSYLIDIMYAWGLSYDENPGAAEAFRVAQLELDRTLANAIPFRAQDPVVPLDPDVFSAPFSGDSSSEW